DACVVLVMFEVMLKFLLSFTNDVVFGFALLFDDDCVVFVSSGVIVIFEVLSTDDGVVI
ncbi:Uncharacterized protein DAT39_022983, partial [Clarias magur]